jgi:anti-anti-sigma factor
MIVAGHGPFNPDFAIAVAPSAPGQGTGIEVRGELDSGTCEELLETVRRVLADAAPKLTLDLREMTFIDSAGTRALIIVERLADEQGIALVVNPPPEHVTELLRTAGMAQRVELHSQSPPGAPPSSGFLERIELELPRDPRSPARARAEVRECLSEQGPPELANIVLLTSELVTNAVVHPRGVGNAPVALRVLVYEDRVRIEVDDTGDGFEHVTPALAEGERGRGLFLVHQFSDRWGSGQVQTDAGPRFRVWFELGWRDEQAAVASG